MTGSQTESHANVWDAIETTPEEAASMTIRAELLIALQETIQNWKMTQADSANRLSISQPRLNELVKGRVTKFSLDALVNLAVRAGLQVHVEIDRAA